MKKYIYMILSAVVLALGFTSCIDEEGPGTPSLKKMHLKDTEFTFDLRSDAKGVENGKTCEEKTADFLAESTTLYWIDVTNATYALSFTNALNTDVKEEITNKPVAGALSTLSVEIPHQQIVDYIEKAAIWQDQFETQTVKGDDGKDKEVSVWFQVASVNLNVTGTPIDKTHTALAPEGSTATATVTIYRDKQ